MVISTIHAVKGVAAAVEANVNKLVQQTMQSAFYKKLTGAAMNMGKMGDLAVKQQEILDVFGWSLMDVHFCVYV